MALTRAELDLLTCQSPKHDPESCQHGPLYLHSRCHPTSPTWTTYANGVVSVRCAECGGLVTEIGVA